MKMNRKAQSATGGVPARTGGYDYSTGKKESAQFNRGMDTSAEQPDKTGGYDYSAAGRASRMYQQRGMSAPSVSKPQYGAALNAAATKRKTTRGL